MIQSGQSMFIITLRFSGLLPAAFRAVAMTIISADHHSNCLSPISFLLRPPIQLPSAVD
jgi:hypothetical protein